MSQKLILPINTMGLTASYDTSTGSSYYKKFKAVHYGCDSWGSSTLYGMGDGEVVAKGYNKYEGYFVCVEYDNVKKPSGGSFDVVVRYFHMKDDCPKDVGDSITKDTKLGNVGNTGKYANNATHLHMEMDTDTKYPAHTPSITSSREGGGLYAGVRGSKDSTVNPLKYIYCKSSKPDNQSILNRDGNDNTYVYRSDYEDFREY